MIKPLIGQLIRFCIVGTLAAAIHFMVVVGLVESGYLLPLSANVIAFFAAFPVSYGGHRYWTFSKTTALHRTALSKLFLVAFSNLFANQGLFFVFFKMLAMPYMLALILVLMILPLITFTLSKCWIFR